MPGAGWLFASLIIGGVGLALFIYGKKQSRIPQLVAGMLLMIYPYFVSATSWMVFIALAIVAVLWWVVRLGW